jgi:PUA domain protein
MLRTKHRSFLRAKEQRELLQRLSSTPGLVHRVLADKTGVKAGVERVVLEDKTELLLVEGQAWLIRQPELLLPALPALLDNAIHLPKVVVDTGAVPHVAQGADVMAPGIVEVDQNLAQGDLVVIVDQKNRTPIAVGRMLTNGANIEQMGKGRAVQTLHHIGDQLWRLMKSLSG